MAASDRGTPALTTVIPETARAPLIEEAFRLEWFTVAWMVIEAAVAIGAGVAAHSITLLAFGIDSLIELASAAVLIWRLTVELRRSQAFAESAEYAARRIGGALLFALAAYVVGAAGWSLWIREGQAFSWSGLLVSLGAMPVMWVLSRRKLRIADALGSRALRADAVESITCGWLSFVVVIGLLAELALGAWWVDDVTSLVIVWLLVKEGREAWKAGEDDDSGRGGAYCFGAPGVPPANGRYGAKSALVIDFCERLHRG
jgi:divalent metal cation (Fe/Co/Zn/Cd) transporter